jgi:hypothetical protein
MNYDEENLIIYLCQKVDGIDENKAIRISGYVEDLSNLYHNTDELLKFKTQKDKSILTSKQVDDIQKTLIEYISDCSKPIKELWIIVLIKDFIKNYISELKNTNIETLLINPFFVKVLKFDDHKDIISFFLYQKIIRSMIGKELWDFIADENGYCKKVPDWIYEIIQLEPTKFSEELEKTRISLIREWEEKFGSGKESIEKVLEKYL